MATLACACVYSQEPEYRVIGGIEVATHPPTGAIVVRWHGRDERIELTDLVKTCRAAATVPECDFISEVLGVYEPTATLYFAAALAAPSLNREWGVFEYGLLTKTSKSTTISFDGWVHGHTVLSPDGHHLAFAVGVRSGVLGACSSDYIVVLDLRDKRSATFIRWGPTRPEGVGFTANLQWIDPTHLEIQANVRNDSLCYDGPTTPARTVTEVIDLAKLTFR